MVQTVRALTVDRIGFHIVKRSAHNAHIGKFRLNTEWVQNQAEQLC